jgi:serine/threonine-protein kinase
LAESAPNRVVLNTRLTSLGKYRLLAEIGHGGMAEVFLAVMEGPGQFSKLIALKVLRAQFAEDPDWRAMFLDEARLAARLNHPNVVQTYEVGEASKRHFIAMEYLDGQPYSRILHRCRADKGNAPLPINMAVRILSESLAGLHYAHELKDFDGTPLRFVHRDVSPHNVFVTYDGTIKVLDFGIAKAAGGSAETRTGVLKGKVGYMAPEYIKGKKIDRRADVFGMGVVLWESLAGKRLFRGESEGDTLEKVLRTEVPPILSSLDAVIAKALAREPDDRFATAGDFKWALEEAASAAGLLGTHDEVAAHVRVISGEDLERRRAAVRDKLAGEVVMVTEAPTRAATPGAKKKGLPWAFLGVALGVGAAGAATIVWAPSSAPPLTLRRAGAPHVAAAEPPVVIHVGPPPTVEATAPAPPPPQPKAPARVTPPRPTATTSAAATAPPPPPPPPPPTTTVKRPPPNPY